MYEPVVVLGLCLALLVFQTNSIGVIEDDEGTPCPQKEWLQIIAEALAENDSVASTSSIQTALFQRYADQFLVICSKSGEAKTVHFSANGDGYCNVVAGELWCLAIALRQ